MEIEGTAQSFLAIFVGIAVTEESLKAGIASYSKQLLSAKFSES